METIVTEKQIIEQENKLYSAIKESDVSKLNELLHNDLLFILPSGETITKDDDLRTYRNKALTIQELHPQIENLNIIEDTAVITLTMGLKGTFNNEPFEAKYRYIRIWKKCQDTIKVVGGSGIAI